MVLKASKWPKSRPFQGRRKVSNIGEAPIKSVAKFPEIIGGAQLLTASNIGGARALVPPLFLRPWVIIFDPTHIIRSTIFS